MMGGETAGGALAGVGGGYVVAEGVRRRRRLCGGRRRAVEEVDSEVGAGDERCAGRRRWKRRAAWEDQTN
jgi:hypothetical protein